MRNLSVIAIASLATLAAAPCSRAQNATTEQIVSDATAAYLRVMSSDKPIPYPVLRRAVGIAIFPGVVKAGFIIGGTGGEGVVLARGPRGWSRPAFYRIGAVSYGFQAGIQKSDIFLVIMTPQALASFYKPRNTLGNDTALAVGQHGAKGGLFNIGSAGIVTYARVQGLFAGLSLQGSRVTFDDDLNSGYYGRSEASRVLLSTPASGAGVPVGGRLLAHFMANDPRRNLVGAVQLALRDQGFYKSAVDGIAGSGTRNAIVAFERSRGLNPTGVATVPLLNQIRTSSQ